jgi:hypothetical protein
MHEDLSNDKRQAVSVYLDPITISRIEAIAFHQDRSVSSVIRRQMEEYTSDVEIGTDTGKEVISDGN